MVKPLAQDAKAFPKRRRCREQGGFAASPDSRRLWIMGRNKREKFFDASALSPEAFFLDKIPDTWLAETRKINKEGTR
jgi:hypothetical protein